MAINPVRPVINSTSVLPLMAMPHAGQLYAGDSVQGAPAIILPGFPQTDPELCPEHGATCAC